jgi:predicted regulator of Ras-like GTPase activity (Roadblock/LC7/MglB family)
MRDDARTLFAEILGDADLTALLLDTRGAHLAGSYLDADGREIGGEIGAALSGIGAEVSRAMQHLELGSWKALVIETPEASIALSPAAGESIVLLAAAAEEPHGLVRRVLARSVNRAEQWLSGTSR